MLNVTRQTRFIKMIWKETMYKGIVFTTDSEIVNELIKKEVVRIYNNIRITRDVNRNIALQEEQVWNNESPEIKKLEVERVWKPWHEQTALLNQMYELFPEIFGGDVILDGTGRLISDTPLDCQ